MASLVRWRGGGGVPVRPHLLCAGALTLNKTCLVSIERTNEHRFYDFVVVSFLFGLKIIGYISFSDTKHE